MAGRLVDLNQPGTLLPELAIVDASVIVDWLEAVYLAGTTGMMTRKQQNAFGFFLALQRDETLGVVTPISFNEVCHVLIRRRFDSEIPNHLPDLASSFPRIRNQRHYRWFHLYKARSDLSSIFVNDLVHIRTQMLASGLLFLQPSDLGAILSGKSLDEELLDGVARYQLDTSDAAFLIEAQRAQIFSVVTTDADLRRAHLGFDLYTWL